MSASLTLLALISYPLLFSLPFNFVRFQPRLRQTPTQTPLAVRQRAEAVDLAVLLAVYLMLIALIAFLLHGSSISLFAVGLRTENWKAAIALGAFLSFIPLSFVAILQRAPSYKPEEEPESRGPLVMWCVLTVVGPFSIELWRVFCIVALTRLNLPEWAAVLLVAVVYGAAQLATNTARAIGAATFGGIAGFLFVGTSSLLAPLVMSLIVAGSRVYSIRYLVSRTKLSIAHFGRDVTCPVCNARFDSEKASRKGTSFVCPDCGEVLKYEAGAFAYVWFFLCLYGIPIILYVLGYRYFTLLFVSVAVASLTFFFGIIIHSSFARRKLQQKLSYGDSGLHLTNKKPPPAEDHRHTDK